VRSAAFSFDVGLVLADSSVAVLALPAIYRELEVDLGRSALGVDHVQPRARAGPDSGRAGHARSTGAITGAQLAA
jgi:hypothetical protein